MAAMRLLEKIQRTVENVLLFLGGVIALALMLLIALDVTLRKLGSPIPGAYELVTMLHVVVVFLGVAYVQRVKGHIFIEIATEKLPLKLRKALDFCGYAVGFIVCAVFARQTGKAAWESIMSQEYVAALVDIPVWPAKLILALGMLMLTLRLGWDMLMHFLPQLRPARDDAPASGGEGGI